MRANDTQVGGDHYRTEYQHWDLATDLQLGYFEGQITKYVTRWRNKNGLEDLEKAGHFTAKLIEGQIAGKLHPRVVDILGTSLALYHYNRANRLWMREEEIVRRVVTWGTLNDLQEVGILVARMIEYSRDRNGNAIAHERDPDSSAVRAKPPLVEKQKLEEARLLEKSMAEGLCELDKVPPVFFGESFPNLHSAMEYIISEWYIAQCKRDAYAPKRWLSISEEGRQDWRRTWASRNLLNVRDPHGCFAADKVLDIGVSEGHRNALPPDKSP